MKPLTAADADLLKQVFNRIYEAGGGFRKEVVGKGGERVVIERNYDSADEFADEQLKFLSNEK